MGWFNHPFYFLDVVRLILFFSNFGLHNKLTIILEHLFDVKFWMVSNFDGDGAGASFDPCQIFM